MPYTMKKVGDHYSVYKKEGGKLTLKNKNKKLSKSQAQAYMRALYSAEGRSKKRGKR